MSTITIFDPWKSQFCTCPKKYSLSAYTGCGHNCLYCYASSYIINFFSPRPKKDFLEKFKKDINKIPANSLITISGSCDPYQPLEEKLNLTESMLDILKNYTFKIIIVTKSNLIIRDINILKQFKNIVICITLTTLDKALAVKLEPAAPEPKDRLKAIATLSKHLPVACRLDPLIWPLNTSNLKDIIKTIAYAGAKQIITSTYKARPDNFKRICQVFPEYKNLWYNLYKIHGEKINNSLYLAKKTREKIINQVKELSLENKMLFSSCREDLSNNNNSICDGSGLI